MMISFSVFNILRICYVSVKAIFYNYVCISLYHLFLYFASRFQVHSSTLSVLHLICLLIVISQKSMSSGVLGIEFRSGLPHPPAHVGEEVPY